MNNKTYKTTTDNRTYKLCRYQDEGICCMRCVNRHRRVWYNIDTYNDNGKYPSWKLVSKNGKQYQNKLWKINVSNSRWSTDRWLTITW